MREGELFERFLHLVRTLRGPRGCPWDRAQTHRSLLRFVLEEAYETAAAIEREDDRELEEELGDLLLQVALHSVLAEERGAFTPARVLETAAEKIIRRHPHVFQEAKVEDAREVLARWEDMKAREKGETPRSFRRQPWLPALLEAADIQRQASRVGFDWPWAQEAWEKLKEEEEEFRRAWREGRREEVAEELGDFLFALVNVARLLGLEAEEVLKRANEKFHRRLSSMEEEARARGRDLQGMTLEELEELWQRSKARERNRRRNSGFGGEENQKNQEQRGVRGDEQERTGEPGS